MVLLFSKVIGVFNWGMAAALAMAAGTSLTITALALLVHSFRQLAVKLGQHQAPPLYVCWSVESDLFRHGLFWLQFAENGRRGFICRVQPGADIRLCILQLPLS